jgi:hypothetical protein
MYCPERPFLYLTKELVESMKKNDLHGLTNCFVCTDKINSFMGEGSFKISSDSCGVSPEMRERFWHSNPDDKDTAGVGTVDEATIIGLGATDFTWTYAPGDEVGVVVEGISPDPTQKKDSSYRIMWAFSKNKCDLGNNIREDNDYSNEDEEEEANPPCSDLGEESDGVKCSDPNYLSEKKVQDLNKCLYDNFVSPSEETGINSKLDVLLTYDPVSPINDLNGNSGDEVSFTAGVSNVQDSSFLNYTWTVSLGETINTDDWISLLKSNLPDSTQMSGLGKNTFKFNLNLPKELVEKNKYLKIKVAVANSQSTKSTQRGNNEVIIPLISSSEKIQIFSGRISDNLQLSLSQNERCLRNNNPSVICDVLKNEIIGATIPNENNLTDFAWTIDGQSIDYTECFFEGCNLEKQTKNIFFPVLKDPGSQFTLELKALNSQTGERISLTRNFKVVEPEIKIISNDKTVSQNKLLGEFIDLNGTSWPDYSQTEFEALANNSINLKAEVVPENVLGSNYTFYVDNNPITLNSDGTLTLPGKSSGEIYDVSAVASFVPEINTKKALNKYWEINYNEFYEKDFGADIRLDVVDSFSENSQAISQKPAPKKVLASIASDLPSYLAFLLRITLSLGLILFVIRLVFSLAPSLKENENFY